jgi:hypothetical protein
MAGTLIALTAHSPARSDHHASRGRTTFRMTERLDARTAGKVAAHQINIIPYVTDHAALVADAHFGRPIPQLAASPAAVERSLTGRDTGAKADSVNHRGKARRIISGP